MTTINSIKDARRVTHYHIAEKFGRHNCKLFKEQIAWRIEQAGWIMPQRVFVSEYQTDVYRFMNNLSYPMIRSVWTYELPKATKFELTIHSSEITKEFVLKLVDFVRACTLGKAVSFEWELFAGELTFPSFAWSAKAWEEHRRGLKK